VAVSGPSPEELASALRATARAAATAALREGLADIDDRYGLQVADEVLGLIDIADLFAGLVDEDQDPSDGVYDPYRLKPRYDQ
jgi:hypothetical protein